MMHHAPTLLLLAGLCLGCGPHAHLYPLIGEDEEILAQIEAEPTDLLDDAPTLAARALLDALVRGDLDSAWAHLSTATRTSLVTETGAVAEATGAEVLAAATSRDPRGATLIERCFGITPARLSSQAPDTPATPPPSTSTGRSVIVYAYSAEGFPSPRRMVLEEHHWRLDLAAP